LLIVDHLLYLVSCHNEQDSKQNAGFFSIYSQNYQVPGPSYFFSYLQLKRQIGLILSYFLKISLIEHSYSLHYFCLESHSCYFVKNYYLLCFD